MRTRAVILTGPGRAFEIDEDDLGGEVNRALCDAAWLALSERVCTVWVRREYGGGPNFCTSDSQYVV